MQKPANCSIRSFLLATLVGFVLVTTATAQTYVAEEEFVGPFSTWMNVKTLYGAVGDGTTDDTTAFQNAVAALGGSATTSVLYIPAGTYKITGTITFTSKINVAIIGEDPATTILRWSGATGGLLWYINGTRYSRFSRVTIDGNSIANVIGVYEAWDAIVPSFDTGNEFSDMVFKNSTTGLYGGGGGFGFAEVTIMRCTFLNNTYGIQLGNFNAKDVYIWHSLFEGNQYGISNTNGAGEFRALKNVFRNSSSADIAIFHGGVISIRHNFSSGSATFVDALTSGNPDPTVIQGNTVINAGQTSVITWRNQGPLLLYDNIFRSASGVSTGPVVTTTLNPSDVIAAGNTYTVSSPVSAAGRSVLLDETSVTFASLSGLTEPVLPPTPVSQGRTIIEVTAGSSTATIQSAITTAAAGAARTVVHLQPATYTLTTSLVIPAQATLQLVGDTWGVSTLKWGGTGPGPVLVLHGPTQAIVKDLFIHGNDMADGLVGDTLDQAGSRVALRQVQFRDAFTAKLAVGALASTQVDMRDMGFAGINVASPVALDVAGAQAVSLWSGASSTSQIQYRVRQGGVLLVRDMWYESASQPGFVSLLNSTGTFTLESSRIATVVNQATPALVVQDWSGTASFLAGKLDDRLTISGAGTSLQALALGMQGPNPSVLAPWFLDTSSPAADARLLLSRSTATTGGSTSLTDIGTADPTFLRTMLAQARAGVPPELPELAAGVTNLRLYRAWISNVGTGLQLQGSTPAAAPLVLRFVR